VSASVDRFNSYYRGFATYSVLRVDQAVVYSSPDFDGLNFSLMYSHKNGNKKSNGQYDNRNQLTVSYTFDDTKVGFGYTDTGGIQNQKLYGVSLSQKIDNFYVGAKYERQQSNISDKNVFGHNGDEAINLFVEYTSGLHTFKSHIANVDNFGEDILHLGYDYQYDTHVKMFVEYYQEQTGAGITREINGATDTYWREGGRVLLVGFSFDFSKKLF
jgi:predicted porin